MRVPTVLSSTGGSQIVEFAISLPLLAVFVVGIFDFGNAFTVKQKISSAAQDGARIGANLPSGIRTIYVGSTGQPFSADIIRDAVDSALLAARLNDCQLASATGTQGTALTWVYSASGGGCAGTLTLTVNRALPVPVNLGGNTVHVLSTQIVLSYPYRWQFNKVITVLVPGATYAGITQITSTVTVPNLD